MTKHMPTKHMCVSNLHTAFSGDSNMYNVSFQANKHLAEENEELNAQLLAQAVREGRHMLQEGSSLAEELDHMTKEEVLKIYIEGQHVFHSILVI